MSAAEIRRRGGARKVRTIRLRDGRRLTVYVIPKPRRPKGKH